MTFSSNDQPKAGHEEMQESKNELKDPSDAAMAATWLEEEMYSAVESYGAYMMGEHFEEALKESLRVLAMKRGLDPSLVDKIEISHRVVEVMSGKYGDLDREFGIVQVDSRTIIEYSVLSDGWGMTIEFWNGKAMGEVLETSLRPSNG